MATPAIRGYSSMITTKSTTARSHSKSGYYGIELAICRREKRVMVDSTEGSFNRSSLKGRDRPEERVTPEVVEAAKAAPEAGLYKAGAAGGAVWQGAPAEAVSFAVSAAGTSAQAVPWASVPPSKPTVASTVPAQRRRRFRFPHFSYQPDVPAVRGIEYPGMTESRIGNEVTTVTSKQELVIDRVTKIIANVLGGNNCNRTRWSNYTNA
ncbi:hypothetical protein FIBSPDRAFT_898887 [Athelia psychrophila]|uniref:Uncharacterized protein n=1 Tax=Athelia psychrophila TaxID=1759441 RepID=A0A166AIG8_9AGAM|nr:hypothetical protein FIBSPDRAFT_898887 [Fibularhizoctonia sp. CBS 109695]